MAKDWQHRLKNANQKKVEQEFVNWGREDFIENILKLRSVLDEQEEIIKRAEDQKIKSAEKKALTEKNYKQEWSYPTKIAFLITLNNKPLTSEELHSLLLKMDSHYKDYDSPRNNLAVTLGRAVKSGRIGKIKMPGIRGLYYALPEWVDKEGKVKTEFESVYNQFH